MISIVDPKELEHVLRPTVYAAAVGTMPPAFVSEPSEKLRIQGRSKAAESTEREPLSP
jgi:hypothetical protein